MSLPIATPLVDFANSSRATYAELIAIGNVEVANAIAAEGYQVESMGAVVDAMLQCAPPLFEILSLVSFVAGMNSMSAATGIAQIALREVAPMLSFKLLILG